MTTCSATANIRARPETIWTILIDAAHYPEWNPGVDHIEGTIALGERIRVFTRDRPKQASPVTVTEFVPGELMIWTGGMPLGLLTEMRKFKLIPKADGSIDLALQEEFRGPLLPLFVRTLPDMSRTFVAFVAALKSRAEALSASIPPAAALHRP